MKVQRKINENIVMEDPPRKYAGINLCKFVLACFIPFLHIEFYEITFIVDYIREYISRLGVPFFFAATGFLYAYRAVLDGNFNRAKRSIKKNFILLITWIIIYSPIFIITMRNEKFMEIIKQLLFRTPGFLWYITALCIALIPFSCIKNRVALSLGGVFYIL